MWQTKCKKKAMWPAKCKKKSDGTGKVQKKCNVTGTVQKKSDVTGKVLKKSDGTGKVQKKSDGTGKVQKKCNWAVCCVSHVGTATTGWNHKPTTSSTCFFFVPVCLCAWICILLCVWSNYQDSTTCPIPSFFYMPTQNTTDAWLTFICLVRCEKKKRKAPIKKMELHINQLCSQGQLTDAVGIDPALKKRKMKVAFF